MAKPALSSPGPHPHRLSAIGSVPSASPVWHHPGNAARPRTVSANAGSHWPPRTPEVFAYDADGNGNVMALVNAAGGEALANYEYGPFGELIRATGPLAFLNPFRFSTKYQDDETGLLYYGYRYYDPGTGRWPNRDPLTERASRNLYGFVRNNPINRIDPIGLIDENSSVAEIEAEVRLLIQEARNRGMNVAADMLSNYLTGGGHVPPIVEMRLVERFITRPFVAVQAWRRSL